jgi:Ca-activated chloride channel family protein
VANINPGESVEVELAYVEEAFYLEGGFSLVFPLTFTPRFVPDARESVDESTGIATLVSSRVPDTDRITPSFMQADAARAPTATFAVTIRSGMPLVEVTCPSHDVRIAREEGGWTIVPRVSDVLADRDVRVEWKPQLGHAPLAVLLTEDREDGRYGLLMVAPPTPERIEGGGGLPTETMFVLDVSGSMDGPSIEQAREALLAALDRLREGDAFNIITFNNETHVYSTAFEPATPAAIRLAKRFIRALEADGGTRIFPALLRAISMFDTDDERSVAARILFLTDGAVGNEAEVLGRLSAGLGAVRLHTIGIGHAPNRYLMRKMAETGRGHCAFIAETTTAENAIDTFFARLARPVITDLSIEVSGGSPVSVYPAELPDLHAGEPLVASLLLPADHTSGEITVRGRSAAGDFHSILSIPDVATGAAGIAHRWARARVDSHMDSLHEGADPDDVRRQVVDVALAHNLVTKYTSLVAVDATATATAEGPAALRPVANALPHGSKLHGATLPKGGTDGPMRRHVALVLVLASGMLAVTGRILGGWRARAR